MQDNKKRSTVRTGYLLAVYILVMMIYLLMKKWLYKDMHGNMMVVLSKRTLKNYVRYLDHLKLL